LRQAMERIRKRTAMKSHEMKGIKTCQLHMIS
jgi:hypothetical protein